MGVGREKKLLESLVGLTTTTILAEFNHTGRHHEPNVGRATCRGRLETQVSLEVLSDLTDQPLEITGKKRAFEARKFSTRKNVYLLLVIEIGEFSQLSYTFSG